MSRRRIAPLIGAIIAMLLLVGVSTTLHASTSTVDIQDNKFVAPAITVTVGDTVSWNVSGVGSHSVTADDGSFDSSPACPTNCLGHGATFSHTFNSPGTYRYYCHIHGGPGGVGMSGVITVVPQTQIVAVGAQSTERFLDGVATSANAVNVHAHPNGNASVPADSFCAAVTYAGSAGTGVVVAPSGTDAGRDALRESVAGTYPDSTSDSGKGCVDIARSDAIPRAIGASGDNASFEYYGFALDSVTWATTSLHAPPALTQAQLQGIYFCSYTDWSQVGGSPGPIQRVLPPDGSGLLDDFLTEDLGITSASGLPSGSGCPAVERIGEDQAYDLFNGSSAYGPLGDAAQYPNAILPFSAGQWSYEAAHSTNPTLDLRAGARPGELVVAQGTTTVEASPVSWTGSTWQVDNSTVVGTTNQVRNATGLMFALHGTTVTAAVGTFQVGDVGKVLDSAKTPDGNVITAVAGDGSSATISPGAQSGGTADGAIGYPIVSEQTVAATTGADSPFPGVHYLSNVIDDTEPSYAGARALVGFQDTPGGASSSLCNGGHGDDILDAGFLPLAAQTSPGGNPAITCRLSRPLTPITGSGSTFAALAMQQWSSTINGFPVNYLPDGSADGLTGFANGVFDFAGSEVEFSELPNPAIANGRGYQYVPDFGFATGIAFHANDTTGNPVATLQLSSRTIAGIFTGAITRWSDSAIAADNPGLALPNQPITVVYPSGATGSTSFLYDYIAHSAPDLFTPWATSNGLPTTHRFDSIDGIPNSGFSGVALNGADQIGQYLASPQSLWSIGYLPSSYAPVYGARLASVRNAARAWVQPGSAAVTAALRHATLNADLSENLNGVYDSTDPSVYPLSAYSYLVTQCAPSPSGPACQGTYNDAGTSRTLASFLRYIACTGQTHLPTIGYARLPGNLSQAVADAIGRLQGSTPETLNASNCANPSF
jgi:phosphate transport system substrate-binding protein